MKNNKFSDIREIYQNTTQFNGFKTIFAHLENLNSILRDNLPPHLIPLCHVGAFDSNTVVIYVNTQQLLHIIQGMSNILLRAFYLADYSFDNLLFKVRITTRSYKKQNNPLDAEKKSGLIKLAHKINRPDLIIETPHNETDDSANDEIKL
ncbi:MAG: hypothetical protein KBD37_08740 [Burkholderiales bacterium]|nr:hypothetical protein [Burkholderiales bacterium]